MLFQSSENIGIEAAVICKSNCLPKEEELSAIFRDTVVIRYGQGALYAPAGRDDLPPYRVLAYYRETVTEMSNTKESVNGAVEGVMNGVPAIAAAEYGKGRVVTISPHPETKDSGIEFFIHNLARWTAKARPANRADMLDKPQQDCIKYVQPFEKHQFLKFRMLTINGSS